jgi:hypothetical protein
VEHAFVLKNSLFFFALLKKLSESGVVLFKVGDVGSDGFSVHL